MISISMALNNIKWNLMTILIKMGSKGANLKNEKCNPACIK